MSLEGGRSSLLRRVTELSLIPMLGDCWGGHRLAKIARLKTNSKVNNSKIARVTTNQWAICLW